MQGEVSLPCLRGACKRGSPVDSLEWDHRRWWKGESQVFLHLGSGYSVRSKDIIAIFDYSLFEDKLQNRKITSCLEDSRESVKSVVLTDREIYLSAISSLTLKKRVGLGRVD